MIVVLAMLGAVMLLAVVVAIYPGELSYVSHPLHRWLYDRSACVYERKWRSASYRDPRIADLIIRHARAGCERSGRRALLDLGCGTGRATRLLASMLPDETRFVAVDCAPAMLRQFEAWLASCADASLPPRVELVERDIGAWLGTEPPAGDFGAVVMLEVAEFLPRLTAVLGQIAAGTAPGGTLIMTRPAGLWWLLFPGRHQSRRALAKVLTGVGFGNVRFEPWRGRYELVLADRPGCEATARRPVSERR